MKKTEIYENQSTDRNIFFIYECDDNLEIHKTLIGINFHHGVGDLDMSYSENDPKLLEYYLEEFAQLKRGEVYNKIEIAERAIDKWMVIRNDWARETIIKEEVKHMVEVLMVNCAKRCYTKSGDISPLQKQLLDGLEKNLQALIEGIITQNL